MTMMDDSLDWQRDARRLIDAIIQKSLKEMASYNAAADGTVELLTAAREDGYEYKNIDWGVVETFEIEKGPKLIEIYIKTCWEYDESWLFCIDFMKTEDHHWDTRHYYRVTFSIPTRRKPVPMATCCVYFIISLSKVLPASTTKPKVLFVIETCRTINEPGAVRFKEAWLKNIIEAKLSLQTEIDF